MLANCKKNFQKNEYPDQTTFTIFDNTITGFKIKTSYKFLRSSIYKILENLSAEYDLNQKCLDELHLIFKTLIFNIIEKADLNEFDREISVIYSLNENVLIFSIEDESHLMDFIQAFISKETNLLSLLRVITGKVKINYSGNKFTLLYKLT
jgi:hypothetical protein